MGDFSLLGDVDNRTGIVVDGRISSMQFDGALMPP